MATGLGIDVGADSIKVVQVRVSGTSVTVTGALKLSRAGDVVLDAPSDDQAGETAVPPHLGAELKRAGLAQSGTLGVSGREVVLKYLPLAPMPPERMKMVIDMEIGGKLTSKTKDADTPEVTYDYRLLNLPSGLKGDLMVMAGICKNQFLFGVNKALKNAGINGNTVTPSCFGLVNAYLRTQKIPPGETVVLVDIGHELLEIAILEETRLYFARSAPGGGKKFTQAIDKVLKMGPQKAAEYKHSDAKIYPEGAQIPSKQDLAFQSALKEAADSISNAVRQSVMFCRTQAKLPKLDYQRMYISGGGARLNGLKDYLAKKVSRPVEILDLSAGLDLRKLDAASGKCFEGEIPDMTVALGLAIIDADPKCFHFSLVPESVIKKRIFWRKTIFGIAAGIVLMAGLYLPIQNSAQAVQDAKARVEFFDKKRSEAATEKKAFARRVEDNRVFTQKVDYYARQTRVGRMYLDLFVKVREEAPLDITITYFGPASDNSSLDAGTGAVGKTGGGGPGFGSWSTASDAVREFVVKGFYDTGTYPGTKFNDAWETMRKKLLDTAGVTKAELEPLSESEATGRPGVRSFQLNLGVQDSVKPLLAKAPAKPGEAEKK